MLPPGWNHEQLGRAVILDDDVGGAIDAMKLRRRDVAKVAIGAGEMPDVAFTAWEKIASEIIVADAFGADRLDYLQRDPFWIGLRVPAIDCAGLIASLRILPAPRQAAGGPSNGPSLGMREAGLRPAKSLVRARHFLFARIFHQPAACANNIHLGDFLRAWLPQGKHPISVAEHLKTDDDQVVAAAGEAARDARAAGHEAARRLVLRQPFKLVYRGHADLARPHNSPGRAIHAALQRQYGSARVRWDCRTVKSGSLSFPVLGKRGEVAFSTALVALLARPPAECVEYVFVDPKVSDRARRCL